MAPHTWSHLGDTVSDATHHMYYRGQRIKEAYYRGEKIWNDDSSEPFYIDITIYHYTPHFVAYYAPNPSYGNEVQDGNHMLNSYDYKWSGVDQVHAISYVVPWITSIYPLKDSYLLRSITIRLELPFPKYVIAKNPDLIKTVAIGTKRLLGTYQYTKSSSSGVYTGVTYHNYAPEFLVDVGFNMSVNYQTDATISVSLHGDTINLENIPIRKPKTRIIGLSVVKPYPELVREDSDLDRINSIIDESYSDFDGHIKLVSLNNGINWHLEKRNWDSGSDYYPASIAGPHYVPNVKDSYMTSTAARRQLFDELTANVPVGVDYGTHYDGGLVRPEYQTKFIPGTNPAGRFFHSAFLYPRKSYNPYNFSGIHYGSNNEELTIFLKNSPSPTDYPIETFETINVSEAEVPLYFLEIPIGDYSITNPNDSIRNPSPTNIIGTHIARQIFSPKPMKLFVYDSSVPNKSYPTSYGTYSIYNPCELEAGFYYGYSAYSGSFNRLESAWGPDPAQVVINNPKSMNLSNYSRIYSLDPSLSLYSSMPTEYSTCVLFDESYSSPTMGLKKVDTNIRVINGRSYLTAEHRGILDFGLTTAKPVSTHVIYQG